MPSQITDVPIISDPVNVVLQRRFLDRARAVAVYAQGTMAAELPTHQGSDTIKWRRYENISPSVTALAELTGNLSFTARSSVVPSITDVTGTVARYGQFFATNEEVDLINPTEQEAELIDVLPIAAGRSLTRLIRNEMEDNLTAIRAGSAASDGAIVKKLLGDTVAKGVNVLQNNEAMMFYPETGGNTNVGTSPLRWSFLGFTHVNVEYDIRKHAGFVPAESYMNQAQTYMNEIGM